MIKLVSAVVIGLTVAGCLPASGPNWLLQPTDPSVATRPPRYSAVTGGVQRFGVVSPRDWRELNERVAPGAQPAPGATSAGSARRGR